MGASGSVRSFAIEIIAVCAGRVRAIGNMTPKSGGKRHRQRVNINAISNHMLASIRWQIAPWWGESASLGDSVSVFQFVSLCQSFTGCCSPSLLQFACAKLAGIDLPVRWEMAVWTKLHENQPLINSSAQVKHIIEGKPANHAGPIATSAVRMVEVDAEFAGQRLDNFLIRQLKGVPKTHVKRSMPRIALSRIGKRCLPLNGQTGYAKFLQVSASEPMKSAR